MKYALVTGGSRGIGKAICIQLAKQGYNILINYASNKSAAEEVKAAVEQEGQAAELLPFNVANREETNQVLGEWKKTNVEKKIEVLVNNAGIKKDNLMMWMKDEEWDDVVDVSLGGFYNVTKSVLQDMVKAKNGRIINVVSLSGLKGLPGQTNYSAAKAAVIGATKALAQEVARRNITVNAVAPGFIKTEMTESIDEKEYKSIIPMRRFGTAEEVAKVVGFLASDASSYITGETISINGGLY
ncbi:3-oxoacyl-[acyl-carrier-protein] reductase [Fulvivirga sp. 29W222]|uniref:3-oxoacyl-[acyl-carrier-protein] reductase n=1 Tax=Fulvivirga marina TaxID=2494733 RepID=A0A937FUZ2_9BACT|nr:3-oxoacyl-[acyl-carrier-protein] reductase [Fulvivirga marina]MBL6446534.1 3-oxoacyl-[acyl-carrier-protein] reductase [Fulvivirga marina]